MATPRKISATLAVTPYFHCTSRCVRGGYLCGVDRHTGADYTHRRVWLRKRLLFLANVFSIKIVAFAIMENHFHVVLRVDKSNALHWSEREVIRRWHQLFKGTPISQRYTVSSDLTKRESKTLLQSASKWRTALFDISWFMRCLKEPLARISNNEDGCKGRFWEGRFHSQALLDSRAVVACMTYVDLNPVRAKTCVLPENDPHTSFHYRARSLRELTTSGEAHADAMVALQNDFQQENESTLPIDLKDYLELVDKTARQFRANKKGRLSESVEPILIRLGINAQSWSNLESNFKDKFHVLVGGKQAIVDACVSLGQNCAWGQRTCHEFFNSVPIKKSPPPIP